MVPTKGVIRRERDVDVETGQTGGLGRPHEKGVCGLSFGRLVGCGKTDVERPLASAEAHMLTSSRLVSLFVYTFALIIS